MEPYVAHRPKESLLYQLVEKYYPTLKAELSQQGSPLPGYVEKEFEAYLQCGCAEHGFFRIRCDGCHREHLLAFSCKRRGFCPSCGARRMAESAALLVDEVFPDQPVRQWVLSIPIPLRFLFANRPSVMSGVLRVVYRSISTWVIKKAGLSCKTGQTGAVTLIQRFGSALNLNLHYHLLFLDGAYTQGDPGRLEFRRSREPSSEELTALAETLARRIGRYLTRRGYLTQDAEVSYLADGLTEGGAVEELTGSSITYRIAVGPHKGRRVYRLQSMPAQTEEVRTEAGKAGGFSLHAGVSTKKGQRKKLERLCRYVSRPAVSEKRLSLTHNGQVRYELKTPYRDGTTHVIFDPLDFIARLVALIPKPRVNLARYHGVFAPNSRWRDQVTPGNKGTRSESQADEEEEETVKAKRRGMSWAQRLKRVFGIDIEICPHCGGGVRIIACIEEPVVIRQILSHVEAKQESGRQQAGDLPPSRAPPPFGLFG